MCLFVYGECVGVCASVFVLRDVCGRVCLCMLCVGLCPCVCMCLWVNGCVCVCLFV